MLAANSALQWLPMALALLAGAAIPFQAASNAALGRSLGHPLWATVASLAISMLVILPLLAALRVPTPRMAAALGGPWWLWLGGVVGVAYITIALLLAPRMGAASFIVAVVAGQMVAALLMDQYGWLGMPVHPVSLARVAGVALILLGMVIVQMQSTPSSRPVDQASNGVRVSSTR